MRSSKSLTYLMKLVLFSSFIIGLTSCGPGLCTSDSCGDFVGDSSSAYTAISFAVSTERTDQAVLRWSAPTSSDSSPQIVQLYSGDNTTCSGSPDYSFSVSSSSTQATWNRFEGGLVGLVRFKVSGSAGTVSCSGATFLRNGVVSVSGSSSNDRLGDVPIYFAATDIADVNGDGVKDILVGDSSYGSNSGKISISLSINGSLTNRMLVEFVGVGTDGLGEGLETRDVTGDGVLDIISASSAALYVLPGAASFPKRSIAGTEYGYRYYATPTNNQVTIYGCDNFQSKFAFNDMNGDGLPEIVVCAPERTAGSVGFAGAFIVIPTGASLPASGDIETLSGARIYTGDTSRLRMGNPTAVRFFIEDITGDGLADITYANWQSRYAAVIPGALTLPASGPVLTAGRIWTYSTTAFLGLVQAVGDFNNDGIKDWALGSDPTAYVIFGQSTLPANGTLSSRASRTYTGSYLYPLSADLTGDSVPELVVFNSSSSPGSISNAGSIHVLLGGALPGSGAISTVASRSYNGEFTNDNLGSGNFHITDINGDGFTDILFYNSASPGGISGAGSVYLVFGAAVLPASGAVSTSGVRYNGSNTSDGLRFQAAGDVNGDSVNDLILSRGNKLELILTSPGYPASGSIDSASSRTYTKPLATSISGTSVLDVNGDGYNEILATTSDSNGLTGNGSLCFMQGAASPPASASMDSVSRCFDGSVASAFLMNGDFASLLSATFKDIVLFNGDQSKALSSAQFIAGASNISNMERRYATRAAWGDSDAPVVFSTTSDLDGDGKPELIFFQPDASLNGFTNNGAIHLIPNGYLYSSASE